MSKKEKLNEKKLISDEYEFVTIPPDGGFGWVIAFAAMLCNLVCDGTLFAFGSMKSHLQEHFKCSDMQILMVGSVPCGVYLLVGPIVSGLANRYGCRIIIIIGSIGAAICMAISVYSPNVYFMILVYGVFGGVFFGMVYLPSVVMVSFYFDKKRAIANGLVTAGTGIGVLSFGPLANYVMSRFGWKIGMIIFAVMMLTCVLFGAIMRPLKPQKISVQREPIELQMSPYADTREPLLSMTGVSLDTGLPLSNDQHYVRTVSTSSQPSMNGIVNHHLGVPDPENSTRPLYKKDALYTGSKQHLNGSNTSLDKNLYMASAVNIPAALDEENKKQSGFHAFIDILKAMTDFSILKNKQMLLICIGNIFSMLGYYLPILCLVSYATDDHKIPKDQATFLMTIFGLFNTIGRFVGGPLAMIPFLNARRVHNILLYAAGILTVLAVYTYNFSSCALYAGLCGFAIAPHMSLLPSVICDCVGIDRYTTAFGVLFLFRGVTSIIGPPAAGYLKDYTERYDLAFIIGGAMIIIAALFHFSLSCIEPERKKESEDIDV